MSTGNLGFPCRYPLPRCRLPIQPEGKDYRFLDTSVPACPPNKKKTGNMTITRRSETRSRGFQLLICSDFFTYLLFFWWNTGGPCSSIKMFQFLSSRDSVISDFSCLLASFFFLFLLPPSFFQHLSFKFRWFFCSRCVDRRQEGEF